MTMRPISAIRPDFSATGMNSPGEIMPRVACFQRTSASMPAMAPLVQRHLRLEIDLEGFFGDGDAQIVLELLAVLQLAPQLFREEGVGAAALLLGGVEREVGMDDEIVGVVGVDRIDGDARAGAGQDGGALEADRLVDAVHDALGDHVDVFGAAGALQDHDELVAAEPHAEVGGAAGFAHALGGDHQHVVAGGMAERVVDLLEAVEVDLHDGHAARRAVGRP